MRHRLSARNPKPYTLIALARTCKTPILNRSPSKSRLPRIPTPPSTTQTKLRGSEPPNPKIYMSFTESLNSQSLNLCTRKSKPQNLKISIFEIFLKTQTLQIPPVLAAVQAEPRRLRCRCHRGSRLRLCPLGARCIAGASDCRCVGSVRALTYCSLH